MHACLLPLAFGHFGLPMEMLRLWCSCRAYKLGKERWSYNQLKVEIHDTAQRMRLDPKLAKTVRDAGLLPRISSTS